MGTPSCPEAPPCTPVLLTACRRRSPLPQRGSTPSGSEAPSWLPSPPSSRCGSQAGVRRVWPLHCAQEVFLRSLQLQATSATLPPCDLGRPPDIKCRVLVVFCLV